MNINNATDFESEPFMKHGDLRAWMLVSGTGTVYLERQGGNGLFNRFPELTFTAPTARVVEIPPGMVRIVVVGGAVDVEFRP